MIILTKMQNILCALMIENFDKFRLAQSEKVIYTHTKS